VSQDGAPIAGARSNLSIRIFWGVVLGAAAVVLCLWGRWPFALLVGAGGAIVLWEWSRIVGDDGLTQLVIAQSLALAIAIVLTLSDLIGWALAALVAGAVIAFFLSRGDDRRIWRSMGVLYVGIPAMALIWLRGDTALGALAILFLFTVVWTADSAAYASGRTIGGPKINPRLSPRKTWAGLVGGTLLPMISGAVFAWIAFGEGMSALALLAGALALAAHAGDLGESAIKRRFGVKDASALIPGHGGLLDRIDGLLFAALTAAAIALVRNPAAPGEGLLLW
jgi:phosphatidate cytidylyltransferase